MSQSTGGRESSAEGRRAPGELGGQSGVGLPHAAAGEAGSVGNGGPEGAGQAGGEGEVWLRTVFDAAPIAMLVVDEGCVVRQLNAAVEGMGGGGAGMVGKRVGEAVGCRYHFESPKGCGFDRACEKCPLWQCIEHTARTGERCAGVEAEMFLGSAGSQEVRHLVLSTTLLPARGPRLALVCLEDITLRRRAEEALRKNAEKFSSVFYLSPDAISLSRLSDGVYLDVNEGFTQILGYSRAEAVGRSSLAGGLNIWVDGGERERWVGELKVAGHVAGFEARFRHKNGTALTGLMSARRIDVAGEACVLAITRDATERKQIEEALRNHQRRLAAAMDLAHLAYWEFDVTTGLYTFNDQFYALYGTTAEREGGYQMPRAVYVREFVHPDDAHLIPMELAKILGITDVHYQQQVEHRIIRRDGVIRHIAARIHVIKGAAGRTVRTYGVNQDITERKLAEEALQKHQRRLAAAMDIAKLAYWDFEVATDLFTFNDQFYALYGTTAEREGGYQMSAAVYAHDFMHPDDVHMFPEEFAALLNTKDPHYQHQIEHRIIRRDGVVRYIAVRMHAIKDAAGRTVRTHGINQDITERRLAEEALKNHRRRLAAAMDIAKLAYWDFDLASGLITFNDQFYALYGTTAEREGGYKMAREAFVRRFVHPDDAPLFASSLAKLMSASDPHFRYQFEHRMIRGDGATRHVAVRVHVIKDEAGRTIGSHGVNQDITERVHLEEQLRQAQKMEAIGRLAGGIAHDFRNHLTVIKGFGELLRENQDIHPQSRKLLDEMLKAAAQSAHLTEQLLLFSRKQTLQPKQLDIGDLTVEICGILPRLVGEDIRVTFARDPGPAVALVDPVQFQQAIFNLAANARDAMPQGGELALRCFTFAPDASFRDRHPGAAERYVALQVTDTGHGIDEPTLSRIFEPFFTTKAVGKGTGLGLASVYGFVNQSGGIVDVHSEPGKGTTFFLYFRQVDPAGASAAATAPSPEIPRGQERILVVEDDVSLRNLVRLFLQSAGYRPVVAANADEALAILGNPAEAVDLMLTDVTMPGLSGGVLAARARELRAGMPVVLMSAYAERELIERGLQESQGSFLPKPFERRDVLQAVRRALDAGGK